jgi:hypothetical protein
MFDFLKNFEFKKWHIAAVAIVVLVFVSQCVDAKMATAQQVEEADEIRLIAHLRIYNGTTGVLLYNQTQDKCQWNFHGPSGDMVHSVAVVCPESLEDLIEAKAIAL